MNWLHHLTRVGAVSCKAARAHADSDLFFPMIPGSNVAPCTPGDSFRTSDPAQPGQSNMPSEVTCISFGGGGLPQRSSRSKRGGA